MLLANVYILFYQYYAKASKLGPQRQVNKYDNGDHEPPEDLKCVLGEEGQQWSKDKNDKTPHRKLKIESNSSIF